ncbi:MAG: hypothetical protein IRZ07_28905 [Microbispora sp.]|nr:hypothetical protein [Microbispora sp.]
MYRFLWRRLPGGTALRVALVLLLTGAVAAALWYVVFPWLAPRVPIG